MNREGRLSEVRGARFDRVARDLSELFPSLHHSKEGWTRDQENVAKPPFIARTGWFTDRERKTTPSASALVATQHFLSDAATPPCGRARRGIARLNILPDSFTSSVKSVFPGIIKPALQPDLIC
jgi:hypothetical protein